MAAIPRGEHRPGWGGWGPLGEPMRRPDWEVVYALRPGESRSLNPTRQVRRRGTTIQERTYHGRHD